MPNKSNKYYYLDINIDTLKVLDWGVSDTATLTGETNDQNVHRVFLTKGQYNKLITYLD